MSKNLEITYLIDFYGDVLTEKQRDVLEQYYNEDLSLAEIAQNSGISRQGVRDAVKRGEGVLLDLEAKIGFVKRYRGLQGNIAELKSLAKNIAFCNANGYSVSDEIARDASRMTEIIKELEE